MNVDLEAILYFRRKINEERTRFLEVLTSGSPKTYDAYKEVTGTIRGLELGDQILADFETKLRKNEDE